MPPQLTVSGGLDELLELLASGAPADAFEDFLDDARRFGVTGVATTDVKAAVWRAMRVHTQIQRGRVREAGLTALIDAARDLALPYDSVGGLLHAIARRARHLLSMDMAYITIADEEHDHVQVRAADGHTSGLSIGLRLPADDGITTAGPATTAPFATHDLLADDQVGLHPAFEEMVRVEGLHAMIAVPLGHGDHSNGRAPRGRLYVASRKVHHFTADERSLVGSLGILAAIYLETTHLRLAAEARAAELEARLAQVSRTADRFREQCDLQTSLVDLLVSGGDLRTLADRAAASFGGRVSVYTAGGDVLVTAGDGQDDGDDTAALAIAVEMLTADPASAGGGRWVAPLCAAKDYIGALVLCAPGDLSASARKHLRLYAQTAALLVRRDKLTSGHDGEVRDRLLDDALSDERRVPRLLAERARRIGLDLSRPYLMVVARPESSIQSRTNAWGSAYARRMGGLRSCRNGHLIMLLPGGDAGAVARDVAAAMASDLGKPVSTGAAGPLTGAESVQLGYREAMRCLDAVTALGVEGGAGSARELGFVGALVSADHDVAGFIESAIGPVLEYDRERFTDLVPTLQAYFDAGGSPTYAAERLHVHTNTVTRRLDRIKDLLGPDWQKPAQALEIQLALRLLRVRAALSTQPESRAVNS
ncbi:PucR-like helix-turn-helix protein [Saccharothrix carnea]|uniref:PucR-like helix-turn-helix protein n=1 Tax=Saccharothrix carnea TaxID=1280637 RepID=A0A2P8I1A4_SACCR|nr:PucR-like helix-turn-helix protein [Saccharothrix carnea]